jgi:hypothetical protein
VAIHAKDLSISVVGSMGKMELITGATATRGYDNNNG